LHLIRWLFRPPKEPTLPREAVAWWEQRRLAYNLIIGATATACFVVYVLSITSARVLEPGEDAIDPLAFMAAPLVVILINICYTAGWFLDAPLRAFCPSLTSRFSVWLFSLGLAFSILIVSLPAIYWSGYRILQLVHVLA
jgi:hypothetical protein